MSTKLFTAVILLVLIIALGLRLPDLGVRPVHGDEAVHAVKLDLLLRTAHYQYDPTDYHGPSLYYFTLPILWSQGVHNLAEMQIWMLRIVPALLGAVMILLLIPIARDLGRPAAAAAALLLACSPAFVFYSRYYIQEMLLVFLSLAAIGAGWRYFQTRSTISALTFGLCLGLMMATKETWVIILFSMAAGLAGARLWNHGAQQRRDPDSDTAANGAAPLPARAPWWSVSVDRRGWTHALAALAVAFVVAAALLSTFLRDPAGLGAALSAGSRYLHRAGGVQLHNHDWYYYLKMLALSRLGPGPWWSEGLILALAAAGIICIVGRWGLGQANPDLLRFLVIYTVAMTAIYSAIPYKTPWCLLGFEQGMILLGGVGAAALIRMAPGLAGKIIITLILTAAVIQLGMQAWAAADRFCVDRRNPYVYAHPVRDVERLAEKVENLASLHPDHDRMYVSVISDDVWPLPWYFRRLKRVAYWTSPPTPADAPVLIVLPEMQEAVQKRLKNQYHIEYYGLRRDVNLALYVNSSLWARYLSPDAMAARKRAEQQNQP